MTNYGFKKRFMIGTWNVRTLSETSRIEQVRRVMAAHSLDVLGLSEVRWLSNGSTFLPSGYRFIYAGHEAHRKNGVGILLSPKASCALLEYNAISDRIITARINSKFRKISIVQCYAPTEPDDDSVKDTFYDQLDSAISKIPTGDIKVFIGDFNAKVGNNNNNLQSVMGRHGLGTVRNNNGDRLVDFCARNRLFIGGTKFPHKDIHKYTWVCPSGRTHNQIDHVLMSKLFLGSLMDVKTRRRADIDSDHRLLVATLRFRPAAIKTRDRPVKFNTTRLLDRNIAHMYNEKLRTALLENQHQNTWADVSSVCKVTARSVLGTQNCKVKPWISDESWTEIQNRKRLHSERINAKTQAQKEQARSQYRQSSRRVRNLVRADREKYYNSIAEQAEQAANTGNLRGVYSAIKQLSGNNIRGTTILKAADGTELTSPEQQLERWRDFFSLQASTNHNDHQEDDTLFLTTRRNPRRDISTDPPSCSEVEDALNRMKNNKASGTDNIPAELLKYGASSLAQFLTPIIQEAWASDYIPDEWKEGIVVALPKKGDLTQCKNWRGITILNAIGKVMATLILHRISPIVDQILRGEQAGFRQGRSCADHINTLRIIIEQSAEYNTPLYLLFVDFERAFDTISRNSMWSALTYKGIPDKIVIMIRELYRDAQCRVRFNGNESRSFVPGTGVRQGCVLSPTLFLLLLDCVLEQTNRDAPFGIRWTLSDFLYDIDYADDICLMAHRFSDIEAKLSSLSENAKKVGLKINISKTKLMRIGTDIVTPLIMNDQRIEDVDAFCYLGSKITKDGGSNADVTDRINKARVAFFSLSKIWRRNNISRKTKIRIFNCSVKSVLLYGCTTWSLTQATTRKIQTFINKCLRQIFNIHWPDRISNEALLQRANSLPVHIDIRKRKWTWIGHILRRPQTEIARTALDWNPQGQRRQGRPRNTWVRCLKQECLLARVSWNQTKTIARDRIRWREFVDALCSH